MRVAIMSEIHPGTIVILNGLESRADLNGASAMLTSKVLGNGRHEAFVLRAGEHDKRPEGINVFPKNYTVNTSARRNRASAWNELGTRFLNTNNYSNALDAYECALDVASADATECRVEGCDSLSLMAWMALRMNSEGVEFQEERRRTTDILQFSLRNIFAEVLDNKEVNTEDSKTEMGAGRIPSRPDPVLLLSVKTGDASRFFFYDHVEKVVHECVDKNLGDSPSKETDDGEQHTVPPSGPPVLPETSPGGQEEMRGEERDAGAAHDETPSSARDVSETVE